MLAGLPLSSDILDSGVPGGRFECQKKDSLSRYAAHQDHRSAMFLSNPVSEREAQSNSAFLTFANKWLKQIVANSFCNTTSVIRHAHMHLIRRLR